MYGSRRDTELASALAGAFLAGAWDEDGLVARGAQALSPRPRWLRAVARGVLEAYHRPPADRPRELAAYVRVLLERRARPAAGPPEVRKWFTPEPEMGRKRWPVPDIATTGDLGALLGLEPGELDWFADVRRLERTVADRRLRHYRYAFVARPGGPWRVIERPKQRLKAIQRLLLHEVLDRIPADDAAHGFTQGRSARTHAAAHVRRAVVIRLDLEDFFASVPAVRVYGIFRTAGYPEGVAHTLTALCTNVVPEREWARVPRPQQPAAVVAHHRLGRRLSAPHLPQGAPTSPALANLAAFRLDRRLGGLAGAFGATYTRYADDLTFSGGANLIRGAGTFRATVAAIARDEGFAVNERKSALMTRAGRQHVTGVVVNDRLNVARSEYDVLKAILRNAALRGPAAENRAEVDDFRAHLLGRIAWVESLNPARGAKLRRRFDAVAWDDR